MDQNKLIEIDRVLDALRTEELQQVLGKQQFMETLAGSTYSGSVITELGTHIESLELELRKARQDIKKLATVLDSVMNELENMKTPYINYTEKQEVRNIANEWS